MKLSQVEDVKLSFVRNQEINIHETQLIGRCCFYQGEKGKKGNQ